MSSRAEPAGDQAFAGARIFDGQSWHDGKVLEVCEGEITGISSETNATDLHQLPEGSLIVPGFVDLQVNGGGGVLFNNDLTVSGIETICQAHRQFGTTALLVTLITDTPENTRLAIAAGIEAAKKGVPGFAGLHLEGPHLSLARKGTHAPELIRPMTDADLALILEAVRELPCLLVTLAPENATPDQVRKLVEDGVVVSLGHSDAGVAQIKPFVQAGASMVTHLYNAMSPLQHREPGMVGAALCFGELSCGLIADGHHVDPLAIKVALKAKQGPGQIFLVTDAMSSIGWDGDSFQLNGREVFRRDGKLTLADGTLAGADIDMLSCVRFMAGCIGMELDDVLKMASLYPARAAHLSAVGSLTTGKRADFLVLNSDLTIHASICGGQWQEHGKGSA
ncbi:N-acetylglucosamine-6-phosphate deacetylase [Roseibium litorale]|uniref:N-acetylglucosamine-6-phosphate deacetylase n=1 Tax=Roseibium litorale TaxID=2803841 RepID=A0ABR9CK52_9HYPH|nr:N-acetylglucosamine-6-phosphate deacetylase [Roseibium litorale]MBD8891232.1 N-acetylglucosamine-6-phosphate deacetylase [Roseibium litorale]